MAMEPIYFIALSWFDLDASIVDRITAPKRGESGDRLHLYISKKAEGKIPLRPNA